MTVYQTRSVPTAESVSMDSSTTINTSFNRTVLEIEKMLVEKLSVKESEIYILSFGTVYNHILRILRLKKNVISADRLNNFEDNINLFAKSVLQLYKANQTVNKQAINTLLMMNCEMEESTNSMIIKSVSLLSSQIDQLKVSLARKDAELDYLHRKVKELEESRTNSDNIEQSLKNLLKQFQKM
ncbi:hypothetical protein WICPIJ_006143 [Wickerhamomyces pijperi]|uniref:Uncharacterized protein n=1 Tax=Wickerhamomyces pijperi TaxID=599730 RepID=A0A9P8Q4C5_WICPI|nr:hypothetical protein WICPIJ_006143 [Wickerhamomyces pijperi]